MRARWLFFVSLAALVAAAASLAYRYLPPPQDELAAMQKTTTALESAALLGWPREYVGRPLPQDVRDAIDAEYRRVVARLATEDYARSYEGSQSMALFMVMTQDDVVPNVYIVKHWFAPESVRFVRRLWNGDVEIELIGRHYEDEATWSPARQRIVGVTEKGSFYRDRIRWRVRHADEGWKVVAKEHTDVIDDSGQIVHG